MYKVSEVMPRKDFYEPDAFKTRYEVAASKRNLPAGHTSGEWSECGLAAGGGCVGTLDAATTSFVL